MATITIELPDSLNDRLANVSDNTSDFCQRAIEAALNRMESKSDIIFQPVAPPYEQYLLLNDPLFKQEIIFRISHRQQDKLIDADEWVRKIGEYIINGLRYDGETGKDLIDGTYKVQFMIPGEHWKEGRLQLAYSIRLLHVSAQSQ